MNQGRLDILAEFRENGTAERRFPGADFAGELDKSLALTNPIHDMIVSLAVLTGHKEIMRVRRDVERRFLQFVES